MAVDQATIDEQLKALGEFHVFHTKKELRHLPEVIQPGETIKALSSGALDGNTWLIVVTDRRVLFLDKGMILGLKQVETPLRSVSSVSYKTGLMFGEIIVHAMGKAQKIELMKKEEAKRVTEVLSSLLHAGEGSAGEPAAEDTISQLERLAALKEKGLLSEEEFSEQKRRLLS